METTIIGKITATEKKPTTCNMIRFWLAPKAEIKIFDVVRIQHVRNSYTYALVRDLLYITDSPGHLSSYVSSDFGDTKAVTLNPRLGTTVAEAEVLYNSGDIEMPVQEGSLVETADADGVRTALGLIGFKNPIPAGYIRMSYGAEVPIEFESNYLLGPEGAHLNIAGISGLATKTSYAMFLLNSIQQKNSEVSMIMFNVKGKDLLAIDEPNANLSDFMKSEWKKCGLEPTPFKNVKYLYPYSSKKNGHFYTISCASDFFLKKQHEEKRAYNYYYDVDSMKDRMPLLMGDVEDPTSTLEHIYNEIKNIDAKSWDSFRDEVDHRTRQSGNRSITVQSWRKFNRFIQNRSINPIFAEKGMTEQSAKKQILVAEAIRNLKAGEVLVIDIEPLPDYLQCLVVGDVVNTIKNIKLGDDELASASQLKTVAIFADELNKYAPKGESGRSLTNILLEVTERGRSLGIILFGAEQFRSGVHERILGNCSTNAFGRTSPVEMSKCSDYRYFPESYVSSITRLEQGSLLLQHAVFKTHLIKVRFPFPCYYKEDTSK